MEKIISKFNQINSRKNNENYSPHKPVLILIALSRCFYDEDRLDTFVKYEIILKSISKVLGIKILLEYPFFRLVRDKFWEVENYQELLKNNSGDVSRKNLIEMSVRAGFTDEVYQFLKNHKSILLLIAQNILTKFFSIEQQNMISTIIKLPIEYVDKKIGKSLMFDAELVDNNKIDGVVNFKKNDYITYLNSLHNVQASGANALAESQALNPYFSEIYQPFPLADIIFNALIDGKSRVIVLTGHAGDGKSTIALDVLKKLRGLSGDKPLDQALKMREDVPHVSGPISIVKDMSELKAIDRLTWLNEAFSEKGCWLIVSNTGPLLNSLAAFTESVSGMENIESDVLGLLDKPYEGGNLQQHTISNFPKELVVLNLARLDNVNIGASLLTRMLKHTGWNECNGCEANSACPLRRNRDALQQAGEIVEHKVRWVYQRITAYERRLTLRQMVGHLAFSLTGGMNCANVHASKSADGDEDFEKILFSENFFGYRRGVLWSDAEELRAIKLIRNLVFGGPIAPDFERQYITQQSVPCMTLPVSLAAVQKKWTLGACDSNGIGWRFALRRMIYFFAHKDGAIELKESVFLDTFLQSAKLRSFDQWKQKGSLQSSTTSERTRLIKECLQVLLETYSGFSAGQFDCHNGRLYLTLRRPDRTVVQPTQLVVAELDYHDFSLEYNLEQQMPILRFKPDKVDILLSLPLLDYIHARSTGSLGNSLTPIHLAQLEFFRSALLKFFNCRHRTEGEINLLRAGIDGKVKLHRYLLDDNNQRLERRL